MPSLAELPARAAAPRPQVRRSAGSKLVEYAVAIGIVAIFVAGIASLGAVVGGKQFSSAGSYFHTD